MARILLHGETLGLYRALSKLQAGLKLTLGENRMVGKALEAELEGSDG